MRDDSDLAETLLRYLQCGSDVGQVAASLHIHPTTVRYRMRKAMKITQLDLDNPDERLATQLQLGLHQSGSLG